MHRNQKHRLRLNVSSLLTNKRGLDKDEDKDNEDGYIKLFCFFNGYTRTLWNTVGAEHSRREQVKTNQ